MLVRSNMIKTLNKNMLFEGLSTEDLEQLARHARARKFPKNTIVVTQGDYSDTLYIIQDGEVCVYLDDGNGKEVILNKLYAGDSFGELAPLAKIPRVANIKTLKATTLLGVSQQALTECISNNPHISMRIINLLVTRIQGLTEDLSSFALMDVYGRVARVLNNNISEEDGIKIIKGISQQEIAKRVGASREMVNRIFKELKSGEYISLDGSNIILEKSLPAGW